MQTGVDIGIDFGTTTSAVGRMKADGTVAIHGPVPSLGAWSNEKVVFGNEAKARIRAPQAKGVFPIRDLKLLLGNGGVRMGPLTVSPVEMASALLRNLKSKLIGDERVRTAVIGTPVRMGRNHRKEVRKAAEIAGFETVRFVYEPTAALVGSEACEALDAHSSVLVVDWGGGTLDVSLVKVEGNVYRELAVDGDIADLGGTQIDEELTEALLSEYPGIRDRIAAIEGGRDRLKVEVEGEKIDILESPDGESGEPRPINPPWLDEIMYLKPTLVFGVMRKFAARAREQILSTVQRAGLKPDQVTHVLYAGGTCKCEAVRQEVTKAFPRSRMIEEADPQQLTAQGCAKLTAKSFEVELAEDFAVRQCDDSMCILLRRGHSVELNSYRIAEFLVTDPQAPEALLDLGLCRLDGKATSMRSVEGAMFQSLLQMHVRVAESFSVGGRSTGDLVRVYAGVDHDLSVAVYAQSNRGNKAVQEFISGVPLAIRVGGEGGTP